MNTSSSKYSTTEIIQETLLFYSECTFVMFPIIKIIPKHLLWIRDFLLFPSVGGSITGELVLLSININAAFGKCKY